MALNKGIAISNFYCQISGQSGGYLESFTPPSIEVEKIALPLGPDGLTKSAGGRMKFGKVKGVTNISEANALWQLIESVMNKNCQEFEAVFGLADQNYKSIREIEMTECLMSSVSFSALEAKNAKEFFKCTFEFDATEVKYSPGSGSVIKGNTSNKAKGWQTSYFDPIGVPGGIPAECITKIDLCKHTAKIVEEHLGMRRRPTKVHAAWDCSGLKIEGSAAHGGYEAARDFAIKLMHDGEFQEGEFVDWSVNIKAPNHKDVVGEVLWTQTAPFKFTTAAEAKGGADTAAQWTYEMLCETQRIALKMKA